MGGNPICDFVSIVQFVCLLGVYQKYMKYYSINFTSVANSFSQKKIIGLGLLTKHPQVLHKN